MSQAEHDLRIDYVEIPANDVPAAKQFYSSVLGWAFKDYGPGYASFNDGRMRGGVTSDVPPHAGGVLLVIYAVDLEGFKVKVTEAGGRIVRDTFDFPGGRRFHFSDPSGNVLAVWSE